ncbi:MAG: trigger factor family protein [Flavobacterium sp.]|uniref:trigger factor family protein n=1 Tax=Flavobacterium sp. TaxID=239 RepID=UPI0012192ECA|nr:MAG: trigger factor family protein [Flavobacterium sp.]
MNITRNNVDALNAVVTVQMSKADYEPEVEKVLANYRKNANIPGFRKGQVPMSLIKKQYGKAVLLEEINKVLQENLNKYLQQEKLEILGNPLPKANENFDLDKEDFEFEFELGLAPTFDIELADLCFSRPLLPFDLTHLAEDDWIQKGAFKPGARLERIQFGIIAPDMERSSR